VRFVEHLDTHRTSVDHFQKLGMLRTINCQHRVAEDFADNPLRSSLIFSFLISVYFIKYILGKFPQAKQNVFIIFMHIFMMLFLTAVAFVYSIGETSSQN